MEEVYSSAGNYDETPRKRTKFSSTSADNTTKGEEYLENKSESFSEKAETGEARSGKSQMDLGREEEKVLHDSGINLELMSENEDESFEIRRIRGGLRSCEGVEGSEGETPSRKIWEGEGRQCQFRGETQEASENCGSENAEEGRLVKNDDVIKKTPDRSLFKKVQEKLLYECNLTPKKPKKKFLNLTKR